MIDGLKPYADRRDAGLPWLGKIPAHWKVRRTKTQFRLSIEKSGKAHGQELLSIYTHIGVRPRKDLEEKGNKASSTDDYWVVRKGDLIVNKLLAWMGAVGVSHYDGVTSPAYDILRPVKELVPDYYHYLFRTDLYKQQFKIRSRGIMEMRLRLYFDQFGQIPIPCPPPEEQTAIVRFLDHADRRIRRYIRAKRQLIALLNEQKQAIIHRAVTRGLDPHVKLKPSGVEWLGDVPEHWEIWQIGHFARVGNGSTPSRGNMAYWTGGTFPWLNSSSVNVPTIHVAQQFVTATALSECHLPKVEPGSVLVAITGQGKTRGMAARLMIETTINQHVAYITPLNPKVTQDFLFLALNGAYAELRRISDDAGSTKGALTCGDLKHFRLALPPVSEQKTLFDTIQRETAHVFQLASGLENEIRLIAEHRTRLIADVVTGKLDVRKAAAALPDEVDAVEPDAEELLDEEETTDDGELDTEPEEIEA